MLNQDKLNRIKGILSAKSGTLVPKFQNPAETLQLTGDKDIFRESGGRYFVNDTEVSKEKYEELLAKRDQQRREKILLNLGNVSPPTLLDLNDVSKDTPINFMEDTFGPIHIQSRKDLEELLDEQGVSLAELNEKQRKVNNDTYNKNLDPTTLSVKRPTAPAPQPNVELLYPESYSEDPPEDSPENSRPLEKIPTPEAKLPLANLPKITTVPEVPKIDIKKSIGQKIKETTGKVVGSVGKFLDSKGMQTAGKVAGYAGAAADLADKLLVDKTQFADDSFTNSQGALAYDAVSSSLMGFSPVGTVIGGAMKVGKLINDLGGSKTLDFAVDKDTMETVGGSYGGTASDITDAASKAGKKYGLFEGGKRSKANAAIDKARILQFRMADIAKDALDYLSMQSPLMSKVNTFNYQFQMNGGYDQRYLRAAKKGTKIEYFKDPFKVELSDSNNFQVTLTECSTLFKQGGTLLDKLNIKVLDITLTDPPTLESFKSGGKVKDREIEVIETNTSQKSVIPEGALHKNKHNLNKVGVDDSELTKKGIPVVDNEGDQLAEIELNEIIFTLEVTKELESRYKEFYEEETSASKKDELALEAGKLLWKEILYNTDDRTGLIDTLKKGGSISTKATAERDATYVKSPILEFKPFVLPEFKTFEDLKKYLKQTGRDSEEDYNLLAAFEDPEVYKIWREEEQKHPGNGHWLDTYKKPNHPTFSTESKYSNEKTKGGLWINLNDGTSLFIVSPYLMSQYSFDYYKKYFENEPKVTVIYGNNKFLAKKHKLGGNISQLDLEKTVEDMVNKTLANIFLKLTN